MDRLIREQVVIDRLTRWYSDMLETGEEKEDLIEVIRAIPSAERPTGHWISTIEDWNKWTCSECGWSTRTDIHVKLGYDFCPKCGCHMVESQERSRVNNAE